MVPLPEHERAKIVIADLVKAILRSQRRNWEPLGSSTFKREETAGVDQIYATILYYLNNKEAVDKYIADWLEWSHQQRKAQELNPHPAAMRLQKIKMEKQGKNGTQVSHG